MSLLILTVTIVLAIWAICSLTEAAIYAVPMTYLRKLEQSDVPAGRIMCRLKEHMERPIAAVLIVNTVVAAAGATVAGAQAQAVFGESNLWVFSAFFTIAALVVSEIMPKILGVVYNRVLVRILAWPLDMTVRLLYPVIWLIERASALMKPEVPAAKAPEDEVQQMAEISAEEGSIMPYEATLVRNVLDLDKVVARDIMTPISVVTTIDGDLTLGDVARQKQSWRFSRLPTFSSGNPAIWTGFVLSRDILAGIAQDQFDQTVQSLAKRLDFVSQEAPGHRLLEAFLKRRSHLFGVVDQRGVTVGIVTLEDVLESLIGAEIVDELDTVVDMQALARLRQAASSDESGSAPS